MKTGVNKLYEMIGKPFLYRDEIVQITSMKPYGNGFEIFVQYENTVKQFIKESEEKLDLWLLNFKPVLQIEEEEEVAKSSLPETIKHPRDIENELKKVYFDTKATFSSLSEKLLQDIDEVRTKPEYVNQAKQVSNTVNTLINLTKLQILMLKNQ
jgi:hypothetical protein